MKSEKKKCLHHSNEELHGEIILIEEKNFSCGKNLVDGRLDQQFPTFSSQVPLESVW